MRKSHRQRFMQPDKHDYFTFNELIHGIYLVPNITTKSFIVQVLNISASEVFLLNTVLF